MPRLKERREFEWQVSARIWLTPGDQFRVTGGPYYKDRDGKKIPLGVRGVLKFDCVIIRGKQKYIGCWSREGYEVLHMEGKRKSLMPSIVCRPYRITGRVRPTHIRKGS